MATPIPPTQTIRFGGKARHRAVGVDEGDGDVLQFGDNLTREMERIKTAICRSASSSHQVSNQPKLVKQAVGAFMRSLLAKRWPSCWR